MAPTDAQDSAVNEKRSSTSIFVARNAKAVVSLLGGVINILAVSAALIQFAPADVAGVGAVIVAVLEALRTANVWIIRNEPVLEAEAAELAGAWGAGAA
ncbi:hypothetical protein OHB26_16435 [Nocardia sp. NBC_01503]|uniref:hypothetical protein n=1 Tax=Nocardia sp. NBC_01503 TaxID=2975997 RepID=UPI002E7BCEBF|nr:hypothetical protein [Nocardia sp. NBC_01503]WTL35639.1 hypothetical protein OHB26_16435 [Nocardia sp. NBC_01503]